MDYQRAGAGFSPAERPGSLPSDEQFVEVRVTAGALGHKGKGRSYGPLFALFPETARRVVVVEQQPQLLVVAFLGRPRPDQRPGRRGLPRAVALLEPGADSLRVVFEQNAKFESVFGGWKNGAGAGSCRLGRAIPGPEALVVVFQQ